MRTRFAVPAPPATFLRRQRLARHLDGALHTPLTMVNGSAGAGKTLLVADWVTGRPELPVAWLTTDADGQGAGMFWAYLLQALRTSGVPLPADIALPADANRVGDALPARLAALLGGRDRPVILVLDEFDRVTAPEIAAQLDFLLRHSAPGLRLVLVTRTEPLLPVHRYRAAGELTEIRDAELAFTPGEAARLMEAHGLRLSPTAVRGIVARTRGWAAGLRLCALAAEQAPDPELCLKEFEADRSAVADFLLAEVLKRQDAGTQELLLRVSVLDRFGPRLASAVTGRADAEAVLARLHRSNAFVQHVGHGVYRLHPLFAEILRAHLRVRRPGLEPELHRRAAAGLRAAGAVPEALGHGAAAGDWQFTTSALVDDLALGEFFTGPRADTLAALFSGMGQRGGDGPAPELVRAAVRLSRGDLAGGAARLHRARQLATRYDDLADAADVADTAAVRMGCALLEALTARLAGAPRRAEDAVREAEALRDEIPAELLDRHPEFLALLLDHLGSARLWAGDFAGARAALTRAAATGPGAAVTALPREDALARLALLDVLHGWPDRAERTAREALAETVRSGLGRLAASGVERLVLAAVAVEREELAQARALLDTAGESHPALRDPVLEAGRALVAARLHLARGEPGAAWKAVEPGVPADTVSPWARGETALVAAAAGLAEGRPQDAAALLPEVPRDQPACAVGAARVLLAAGRPEAAVRLLDRAAVDEHAGPAVTVRAALVRARAADRAGDTAAARRLVTRAVREAHREGLRRPLAETGTWIRPYLYLTTTPHHHRRTPPSRATTSPPPPVEELSGRERDVLRRLAQAMSTEEIAADLYVSVNTVKTHLKNAYRKLSVGRRNEAVRRARELGLL
ncbi:LuxR C-terminal-related transcriptional regulator [Streptomyces lusitanus]|uniref:LuxR C-terminal-related transcriptional regulator n=1 Tax=Streptomyces lusitanus TaxID=68232 RepID=A0ABU3JXZ4_9ACTN|nr:LuxR C-terminal-related transcriptional regulator [Streptomyces lusitanus]